MAVALGASAPAAPQLLDDFEAPQRWAASASDGVTGTATKVVGAEGAAVRLDYDFTRGSGYAVLRRELPLDLSGNFALRFKLRGQGLANALEVKLVDASGDNVWWHRYPDLAPPGDWKDFTVKRRQVKFAWGPTSDKTLRRVAAIEFVVAAGKGGGKGWIAVDDLTLERLPEPPAVPPPVTARGDGMKAVDGRVATAWSGCGGEPLDLDLGYAREFGGLVLRWGSQPPADYTVALSDDARRWRTVHTVHGRDGGADWLRLPESQARYVRVQPLGKTGPCSLAEVEVKPLEFGETANAFLTEVAREHRRGGFPRGFVGEQNYWTLVATPEGGVSGLMDESGAVENSPGGFSIEPFVRVGERLVTWADVAVTQSLKDGYLPMPAVRWQAPGWALHVSSFAAADGNLIARYELENLSSQAKSLDLVLAVRPLQVNPPQQFLNITGGVSPI
ncbi:MAG: discoidin domain-containing protein, partial [Sphingomonas sp.]|nr:discoidin domain-containing protein [Sphingomonas sp.]